MEALKQRADAIDRAVEDVATEALLRGIMQQAPDRADLVARIRALTLKPPEPREESVAVIRDMRR